MTRFALVVLAVAMISACGGGGGSSGFNNDPPVAAAPKLTISAANGEMAAKTSYEAATNSVGLTDTLSNGGLVADAPTDVSKAAGRQVAKVIGGGVTINSVPFGPQVNPCLVDGSITISGNIASLTSLTAGDTFLIDADQCDDGLDQVVDGLLDLEVVSISGDFFAGLYDMRMSMVMTDFQVTTPADTLTSNGDATISLNTTLAPLVSASISGDAMTIDSNSSSETLTAFGSEQTVDAGVQPAPYTWSSYGTLDSSQLDGVVDYTTPVTFAGEDADYPHTGELFVEGENSSVRLIAVDNVSVRIELDYDGDDQIDEIIETTWVDLSS